MAGAHSYGYTSKSPSSLFDQKWSPGIGEGYCRLHNSVKPNFFCASSREGFPQPNKEDQTTDKEFSPRPCFPSRRYPLLLCWKSVEYEVELHINSDNCSRCSRWLIFLPLIRSPVPFPASHSTMSNCYTSVRTSSNHPEHIQRIVWSFKSFERGAGIEIRQGDE